MFGFIIGAGCLLGLYALKHGRCGGWHHRSWRRPWRGPRDGRDLHDWRDGGRRLLLHYLSDRLEATPGQERAIAAALDKVAKAQGKAIGDVRQAALALARELRGDHLDRDALQRHVSQAHGELVYLEEALLDALTEVHDALEPDQRRRLAELVEEVLSGRRAWGCCGEERAAC
jgi:hypothetical protein